MHFFLGKHSTEAFSNSIQGLRIIPQISDKGRIRIMKKRLRDTCCNLRKISFPTTPVWGAKEDHAVTRSKR